MTRDPEDEHDTADPIPRLRPMKNTATREADFPSKMISVVE